MDYGEVISKAARIIWKFKILWLFGLLAGCASGNGSGLNYLLDRPNFNFQDGSMPEPYLRFFDSLNQFFRQMPGWFLFGAFLLGCGLGLLFWLIAILGRTGVARGAWLADGGAQVLGFGQLINDSLRAFWRSVCVNLLVGIPSIALTLIFASVWAFSLAASLGQRAQGLSVILLCLSLPICCLLVPVFWLFGIWSELSMVAVVGEGRGVIDALRRGWRLMTRNFGPVLIMALLVLVAQIGFGILVALLFAPVGLGVLLSATYLREPVGIELGLIIPLLVLAGLVSLALGAVFQSFIGTIWALVFNRLAAKETLPPAPVVTAPPPLAQPPLQSL